MTGDIWILKLLILLTLSASKLIVIFLTLSSSKLVVILLIFSKSRFTLPFAFTDFGQVNYFTESGQDLSLPKTISTLSV